MHKIIPHLWYNTEAREAAVFYSSIFSNSRITQESTIREVPTPSGDCDIISFELRGQPFMAISAGPLFTFNPSVSFIVNFDPSRESDAADSIDTAWEKLSRGGRELMPIGEYPWSARYGWVVDRYGVSWQLILTNPEGEERPEIVPSLLFSGRLYGKTEEAINYYLGVFRESRLGGLMHYGPGQEPNREGTVMFADFKLLNTWIAAMDGPGEQVSSFNEAISLLIPCDSQKEIDYYWEKLSADPAAEQCGWLKDTYGLSWQVWPTAMGEMMANGTDEQIARVTRAFLPMKKFNLRELEDAFKGKNS